MPTPNPSSPPEKDPDSAPKPRLSQKRKRGAQPGNKNAYEHGFYSAAFRKSEGLEISSPGRKGQVQDEINLLRVLIADIASDIQPDQTLSFQENISALYTVSLALARLDSLRLTNHRLQAVPDSDQGLKEFYKRLGLTDEEVQAEIDEMNGLPATPITSERWVEILKGMGLTDEEIQTYFSDLTSPRPIAKKAPGGQPANTNALKHGFYASLFNSDERRRLEKFDRREIDDDIILLRVLIKRAAAAMRHAQKNNRLAFSQRLTALRVITYAISRLERLQRTKALLLGPKTDRLQLLLQDAATEQLKKFGFTLENTAPEHSANDLRSTTNPAP